MRPSEYSFFSLPFNFFFSPSDRGIQLPCSSEGVTLNKKSPTDKSAKLFFRITEKPAAGSTFNYVKKIEFAGKMTREISPLREMKSEKLLDI